MGRRAVRRPDPALDLTPYLKTFEQLPCPWSSGPLFERDAPLEVEMGSGKGLFMATAASECPEHNFLGIEVATKFAAHAAGRLAKRSLRNAVMVHGDGLRVFRELLPAGGLEAVHVYFPDPWWKARHRKRRVMNEAFVGDVIRTLRIGGHLHFWTDVEEYFQTTLEMLTQFPLLEGPLEVPERQAEHEFDYRTHFERRMRMHGAPVYRSLFRRRAEV